jgi:hypothetical protein
MYISLAALLLSTGCGLGNVGVRDAEVGWTRADLSLLFRTAESAINVALIVGPIRKVLRTSNTYVFWIHLYLANGEETLRNLL